MIRILMVLSVYVFACTQCAAANSHSPPPLSSSLKKEIAKAKEAIKTAPTGYNYWQLGGMYKYGKHFAEAVPNHSKAIQLEPRNSFYWLSRALDYQNLEEWDKSIEDASKALSLAKPNSRAYADCLVVRCYAYSRQGRGLMAKIDFQELEDVDKIQTTRTTYQENKK